MEDEKSKEIVNPLDGLTPQNRLFLFNLLGGMRAPEAYKAAGYEGESTSAPYTLKSRLAGEFEMLVKEGLGLTKGDLMAKLGWALNQPVVDRDGVPVKGIEMGHLLKAIDLQTKILAGDMGVKANLTMIQINRFQGEKPGTVVDV